MEFVKPFHREAENTDCGRHPLLRRGPPCDSPPLPTANYRERQAEDEVKDPRPAPGRDGKDPDPPQTHDRL